MVFEEIINPRDAEHNPYKLTLLGFFFASVGLWLAWWLFPGSAGLLSIFLTVMPLIPILTHLFEYEGEDQVEGVDHKGMFIRYFPIIMTLMALFGGLLIGYTFWFSVLPDDMNKAMFNVQMDEFSAIRGAAVQMGGEASVASGQAVGTSSAFETIFGHNLGVLALIVLLSVTYGAGAIYIIAWNASVMAVFFGTIAKGALASFTHMGAMSGLFAFGYGLFHGASAIGPHAFMELLAYLIAAIAGCILSAALVRKVHRKPGGVAQIVFDVAKLFLLAVICLAAGAAIESLAFA